MLRWLKLRHLAGSLLPPPPPFFYGRGRIGGDQTVSCRYSVTVANGKYMATRRALTARHVIAGSGLPIAEQLQPIRTCHK